MPKKTRLQKLRNQTRINEVDSSVQALDVNNQFFTIDPYFKKDLIKSIFFAIGITVFEIALYFIYYLRVFERR